jgi:endonuclease YncB( thermonuclease family)
MKNKKIKTIMITALAGCMLLSVTAMASANGSSGYETYKSAVKNIAVTSNATFQTSFEVKDNGNTDISGTSIEKLEGANNSSSTKIKIGDTTKETETSRIDGRSIIKDGESYYSRDSKGNEKNDKMKKEFDVSSSKVKLGEMVLDTLVGDVKNQFVVNGDTISVNLEGAQIPELAKLAISAAAEEANSKKDHAKGETSKDGLKEALNSIPNLKNIDIKSLSMTAKVNGSTLTENDFKIVITGDDASGVSHEIEVSVDNTINDVNSTKADSIDTTGKQVQTMQNKMNNRKNMEQYKNQ